jgi:hypothetical protein
MSACILLNIAAVWIRFFFLSDIQEWMHRSVYCTKLRKHILLQLNQIFLLKYFRDDCSHSSHYEKWPWKVRQSVNVDWRSSPLMITKVAQLSHWCWYLLNESDTMLCIPKIQDVSQMLGVLLLKIWSRCVSLCGSNQLHWCNWSQRFYLYIIIVGQFRWSRSFWFQWTQPQMPE